MEREKERERTAVKIANKYCMIGLENILVRTESGKKKKKEKEKKKNSEVLFRVTLMSSALTSVQNMFSQQHFSIKLG